MSVGSQYEIFEQARKNNLKRVKELLDTGVDVNLVDFDNGNTPLHYAASNGAKQTMDFLVERGANLNAANDRGLTPLHMLITKRYDALALLMVKQGCNLHQEDKRGYTPRDLALGWFQRELDDAESGKMTKAEELTEAKETERKKVLETSASNAQGKTQPEENLKIYTASGSYKTIHITPSMTASELSKLMAEKLNILADAPYLEVFEQKRDEVRRVQPGENIMQVRANWPLIFGPTGNETHMHCNFSVKVSPKAPEAAMVRYKHAVK